jgi:putative phosphoesterase
MRIAILSDSHDHIPNLHHAVQTANREDAEVLIHCGDLISPFMLSRLHEFNGAVHLIYGNNAGDQHIISTRCATMFDNITHHGVQGEVKAGGLAICFIHYPNTARALAATGSYDVVCCGHNHIPSIEQVGECLLLNPGDLLGKDEKPGFLLLNSADKSVRRIIVGELLQF